MNYKQVDIYVDKNRNLIVVANGLIDKWGGIIAGIDVVEKLDVPYTEDMLKNLLISMMDKWCSRVPVEGDPSPLEKFLGVKGYSKAVKGRKLICFSWNNEEGYIIRPSIREKKGFSLQDDQKITLGKDIQGNVLADAITQAIEASTAI